MLAMIFLCVAFGLAAPRFGTREHLVVALMASAMTALYFVFPNRFM